MGIIFSKSKSVQKKMLGNTRETPGKHPGNAVIYYRMYLNFEAFKGIEKIEKVEIFLVFPNPMGILNQKNLWPTLIYQFEHSGTP